MASRPKRERRLSPKLRGEDMPSFAAVKPTRPDPHPSTHPIDASLYSDGYLRRQLKVEPAWFRHLDFLRMPLERIKSLFWNQALESTHRQFIAPPMALRRTYRGMKEFFRLGSKQKLHEVQKYAPFDEELRKEMDSCSDTDEESQEDSIPDTCVGLSVADIRASMMEEERKSLVELGFKHLIRESLQVKYKMLHPSNLKWKKRRAISERAVTAGAVVREMPRI